MEEMYINILLAVVCGLPPSEVINREVSKDEILLPLIKEAILFYIQKLDIEKEEFAGECELFSLLQRILILSDAKGIETKSYTQKEIRDLRIAFAKELLTKNISTRDIAKRSGLSRNEVRKIKEEMKWQKANY